MQVKEEPKADFSDVRPRPSNSLLAVGHPLTGALDSMSAS